MRIHPFITCFILISTLCASQRVLAQSGLNKNATLCNDAIVKRVGKYFKLDSNDFTYNDNTKTIPGVGDVLSETGGNIVAGVCKPWPGDTSKVIAAFAYSSNGQKYEEEQKIDIYIAIFDKKNKQISASYKYEHSLGEPGGLGSIMIDTAPYRLSSTVRAFGIDVTNRNHPPCADGGAGAERTLYVQEGKVLRPILVIDPMSKYRLIKGFNCGSPDPDSENISEDTYRSIGIADSITNGYRDIIITSKSSRDDGKHTSQRTSRHEFRYDGKYYNPVAGGLTSRCFEDYSNRVPCLVILD